MIPPKFKTIVTVIVLGLIVGLPAFGTALDNLDAPPPEKRTVYVIGNIGGSVSFPLQAYIAVQDDLYIAETWYAKHHELGPVGLAIDETNENLFVSYESANLIEVFDARTATPLGTIYLYGTDNLAGMVVHQQRGHLYVVDRWEKNVFVYNTTNFEQEEMWVLPTGGGAFGIDMLEANNWLFVADGSNTVRYYDIDTGLEIDSFSQPVPAIGIAVTDYPEPLVFTTAFDGGSDLSPFLTKWYLQSGTYDQLIIGTDTKGVSLNPALGLAYVVADNRLQVVDYENMTLVATKQLNFTWSPTDCLASFIPFGGTVKKTSPSHPRGKIYKGDTVTFKIAVQNRHVRPIHEMPITDEYDNTQLSFVSADPPTDDNVDDGVLDWSDVIAQVGQDLPTGEWLEIEAVFEAIDECDDELEGVNTAMMHEAKDDQGTTILDASGQFDYLINCKCQTNLDCDDGQFCTGQEICNAQGQCVSPGNPCPLDDGLWCNGTETATCNEDLDECGHENEPCPDDGSFCNGEPVCNENTDTCTDSGPPCSDDGQFCNGAENCDEQVDKCTNSGDPCGGGEQCNEATDQCDASDLADDDSGDENPEDEQELWPKGKVTGGCCGCE